MHFRNFLICAFIGLAGPSFAATRSSCSYDTIEYIVNNSKDNIQLCGTLTMPQGERADKIVIMASGSGAQDRDETVGKHKPFRVIADSLSRNGYAVLRLDDRGVGASQGDASTITVDGYASDIAAAIDNIRLKYPGCKVGIFGHSEGGSVAIKLAAQKLPDFIITYGAPLIPGTELMLSQVKSMMDAAGQGASWEMVQPTLKNRYSWVASDMNDKELKEALIADVLKDIPETYRTDAIMNQIESEVSLMCSPEYRSILKYNPAQDISAIDIPWLALYGEKDVQVPASSNYPDEELSKKSGFTYKVQPSLNHMMQKCTNGLPNFYNMINETVNPAVINDIIEWMSQMD